MSRPHGVSVVIPTVDREAALERALAAVARAARRIDEPVEAIVADDSRPAARHRPSSWTVDELAVRRIFTVDAGEKGPAAARNAGVEAARFDLIAFTDDDAHCDDRWLLAAVSRLRIDPSLAGIEGAVRLDHESPLDPVRARIVMNLGGGGYLTASLFARADAIREIGGFRRLRVDGSGWAIPYREDTDLGLRLIREVGPVPFVPGAFVLHPAEPVDLRRLWRLGRYFVVDAAFARLHPDAIPPVRSHPLARLRIRLATTITLLSPLLLWSRARFPAALTLIALGAAVSAELESELRAAGVRRTAAEITLDTARRLPRSLAWSLAAGSARLQGEAMLAIGAVTLPEINGAAVET